MDLDKSNRTIVLEGFPLTDNTERDVKEFIRDKFDIETNEVRRQNTLHLTTSNTPNWIVLCNSMQDASSMCHDNIRYMYKGTPCFLKTRFCSQEEIQEERPVHCLTQTETRKSMGKCDSVMSVNFETNDPVNAPEDQQEERPVHCLTQTETKKSMGKCDSLISVNFETKHPVNAPEDQQQELQSPCYGGPKEQHKGPPESMDKILASVSIPGYPSCDHQLGFPQSPNLESKILSVDKRLEEPKPSMDSCQDDYAQKSEQHEMLHSESDPSLTETYHSDMTDEYKPPSYQCENTIEVHGSNVRTSGEEAYKCFFENPRKGGGDVEDFRITEDDMLLVTFKDHSVAQKLAKEGKAVIEKTEVIIKLHILPPLYKNKVLLEYEGAHLDQSSKELHYYIEARSKRELTKVESGSRQNALLLTFQEAADVQTLQTACRKKLYKDKAITVQEVPATNVLQIHGIPNSVSNDTVKNYFETRRCGNNTNTEVVKLHSLEEKGSYLLHFENYDAPGRIAKRTHALGKHPITVSLYHKCIGSTSGYIRQGRIAPEAKRLHLTEVNPLYFRFLRKSPTFLAQLNRKVRDQTIKFIIHDGGLYVESEGSSSGHDAKYNDQILRDATSALANNIACFHIQTPDDMRDKINAKIVEIGINPTIAKVYTSVGKVAIVGCPANASKLKEKLELFLQTDAVTDQMAEEKTNVMEPTDQMPEVTKQPTSASKLKPLEVCYLSEMGFEEDIRNSFPTVRVHYDLQANEVCFCGPEDIVNEAKVKMFENISAAEIIEVQNISEEQISLLAKPMVASRVLSCFREKGIIASWMRKQSTIEIISNSKLGAEEAKGFIFTTVIERVFPVENNMLSLLSSESWAGLLNELSEIFPDTFSITNVTDKNYLLIVGLRNNVDSIYDAVSSFFTANVVENTIVEVSKGVFRFIKKYLDKEIERIARDLKSLHVQIAYNVEESTFRIHASEEGIKKCKHRLGQLISKVMHHKELMQKAGIAKMLTSEEGAAMVSHVENMERCTIEVGSDAKETDTPGCTKKMEPTAIMVALTNLPDGRKIYVRQGDITSFHVGAIVNAANQRLDHCGGLAKAIVDKGGVSIQEECQKYVKRHGEVLDGDAVLSDPGRLPCDVIVHAVGPRWEGGDHREEEYLTEAIIKSLELAESRLCVSVAIPGLSTGIFGYPTDAATRVITATVRDYFRQKRGSAIKDVYLCDNDSETVSGFVIAMKQVFGEGNIHVLPQRGIKPSFFAQRTHVPEPSVLQNSGPKVVLVKGKIAEQKADVIVNSTNQELQLIKAGQVSKSLLEAAGQELQYACSQDHPHGITPGSLAATQGGKLQCKKVYHVFLPQFSTGQKAKKEVRDLVMKCLANASSDGVSSMAFPALGTGGLKYPRELVAQTMITAIQDYWIHNPRSTLKDVRIILYENDQETIKAFENQNGKFNQDCQSSHGRFHRRPHLVRGSITRYQADVIVNPTNDELDLNSGPLSRSIAEAAGPALVSEIKLKFANGVPHGGLAVSSAGHLNAKEIYHVIVKDWTMVGTMQHLSTAITTCLEEAHKSQHTSILFPTLGIGSRGYDKTEVAKTMYRVINSFWTNNPVTTLKDIKIVIYDRDTHVAKVFEQEKMAFYHMANPRKGRKLKSLSQHLELDEPIYDLSGGVTFGNIQFKLIHGDLLEEKVDCIINSVHPKFDLNAGTINQLILQKLGHQILNRDHQKVEDIRQKGFTITEVTGYCFKKMIHFQDVDVDVKKYLKICIKAADKAQCSSVALPALGQGPYLREELFFEYLYDTLIGLSNLTHITEVRLVVFDQPLFERYIVLLEKLLDTQGLKKKSVLQRMKDFCPSTMSDVWLKQTIPPKQTLHLAHTRHVSKCDPNIGLEVSFFSDTQEAIQAAQQTLQDAYDKEFCNIVKDIEALKTLDEDKIQRLHNGAKHLGVSTDLNQRLGRIRVQGIKDDVNAMVQRIYDICLEQRDDEKAEVLGSVVQWHFMLDDEVLAEYDPEANIQIEKSFRGNKEWHVIEDTAGLKYVIDFREMVEYREDNHSDRCPIIRKDLIKAAEFDPPPSWDDMGTENLKLFRVSSYGPEYERVSEKFASTNKQIVEIKRIQNKTLYKQYQAKKQLFEQRTSNTRPCESELWHGTATDAIHSITKEGFNRSYCGKNAVAYGLGVYFAVNASYSTQDQYARPDPTGKKYIFLVDVLTGECTQGQQGMRVPPPVDATVPSVLYDSVVDNVSHPSMFVIFNDTQAYPKYLITFK